MQSGNSIPEFDLAPDDEAIQKSERLATSAKSLVIFLSYSIRKKCSFHPDRKFNLVRGR
jgi:hypothetical protein